MFDESVTPLWKAKGDSMTRVPNNTAYHAVYGSVAKMWGPRTVLKKGVHVTSNVHDAFYWAIQFGVSDRKGLGAVVYKVDLAGKPIGFGDQSDNPVHATLKAPCTAVYAYYISKEDALKLENRI
jgi:hypothetical protein